MRLLRPLAILALVLAAALMPAAEVVTAKLAKKSNVRYGPSKSAAVAVTLPSDAAVEILGKVVKDDGVWYQIRFPREGRAWMHAKTLKDLGNNQYQVIEDKARVRDDATGGANIVSELNKGDVVEFRANRVGDWLAVYPPSAVAYIHESVLAAPQVGVGPALAGQRAVERLWTTAKATYTQYAGHKDLKSALTLDWPGLSQQLAQVAKEHPELAVRIEAARLRSGVEAVVQEQAKQHAQPTVSVPQPPAEPVAPTPRPADPAAPAVGPQPGNPVAELPKPVDTGTAPAPVPVPAPAPAVLETIAPPAPSAHIAEGFLEQRGDIYVVINSANTVVAVLQAKPGATLQLSDYYWREIGVKGTSPGMGKDDQGKDVPIVLVDDIELLKH
jgi:uncharacterized protein YgiM (DUF1202 family)